MTSSGTDAFRLSQRYATQASQALEAGDLKTAKVYAELARIQAELALAAATVLTSNRSEAGTYRLAVGDTEL